MKVGFTGTREGMTDEQADAVLSILERLYPQAAHHGDCIGADERFHGLVYEARQLDCIRVVHPPADENRRAFCEADEWREAFPYLTRNRHIVRETDVLIATPRSEDEELASGTWATIRYARKLDRKIFLVLPDGTVKEEGGHV